MTARAAGPGRQLAAGGAGYSAPDDRGDTAPRKLPPPGDQDWTSLRAYDRVVEDGWVIRIQTDGKGALIEIREKRLGNYGLSQRTWDRLRTAKPKRTGIATGNLQRVARKYGRQHRILSYLAQTRAHGARAGTIADLLDTSPTVAGSMLRDLALQGHAEFRQELEPIRGPTSRGGQRPISIWTVTDTWRAFLPWALYRIVESSPVTASGCAELTGIGYERTCAALAEMHRAGQVGRLRTDIGYLYFTNGAKPNAA